uniref:Uncharacterized protein n=1 Tax=Cacopsylla melanoneura TaxID=428564 RepID=A0A8D9EZ06_9HEMI
MVPILYYTILHYSLFGPFSLYHPVISAYPTQSDQFCTKPRSATAFYIIFMNLLLRVSFLNTYCTPVPTVSLSLSLNMRVRDRDYQVPVIRVIPLSKVLREETCDQICISRLFGLLYNMTCW